MEQVIEDVFSAKSTHVNYLVNWSKKYQLIYVETPKVGCTTIKQILQYADYGFDDSALKLKDHDQLHDRSLSPLNAPSDDPEIFLQCLSSNDYFVFSFVRNPFSRVLSAYLDKIVGHPDTQNQYQRQLNIDPNDGVPTFGEFIELIYSANPVDMDPHWAPQSFLLALDNVQYDFLGRFEFFDDSIHQLISRVSLKLPPSVARLGKQHSTSADQKLHTYYDARAIRRVREIYHRDFERLGYGWSI